MLTGTFVRPLTAYHVISVCRFRSLPAKVSHLDIWIPSDPTSRWTPCLWLTLPAAERVVVSRHLVVLMNGLVCINWRKIGVWRILFKIRKPDLPRHHREKSDFHMIDVKINRASRPPGCGRPPSAGSAFPDRPRGGRRKSTCRRNQCPSSGAAAGW